MTTHDIQVENRDSAFHSPAGPSKGDLADENSAHQVEAGDSPPMTVVAQNISDVERLTQELADSKDRYLRTIAEMDNMRKRLEREKSDFIKFSNESLLKEFIPILDSLEKAIPNDVKQDSGSVGYIEGVVMVQKQLLQTLGKFGLEAVRSVDQPFDPNVHQAIQRIESDVSSETVSVEFAKGYTLNGRLLRPAMVAVKVPK
ncbi:MAG: nucleotide exchange factor GrpE [Proteobacteria bacterium]|nr:nucleotide exchange factor GrpE [Pseudomonadota bacterium]